LTLEGLKQNAGTDASGQRVHQALLAAKYAANIEEDVYTAPEPVFKMLPKCNDRKAHRIAFFGSSPTPPAAVQNLAAAGVGLADASHNGVIAVSGADRYRFVNGLCTNKVLDTKPGQVVQSCFTTKTGRKIDLTTMLTDSILILFPASRLQSLYESFDALI
jgi:glycine cleavage system aminomethyltransferase T